MLENKIRQHQKAAELKSPWIDEKKYWEIEFLTQWNINLIWIKAKETWVTKTIVGA